ncbi:MAG TPA: hypothetical protein VKB62_16830 [Streptosporangiaceae bacterium]|nr:hypothetical protein [Streptosporangiaceae bacterium]
MSASGEGRFTTLERRCRLLLRAYPAAYRAERGEEIVGTLVEATPGDRAWPLPRDIRGLAIGSLRARAQLNRCNTTAANLRVAVFAGVAAYLAYEAAGILGGLARAAEHGWPFTWHSLVVATLNVVTLVLAWLSHRRTMVLAGALPAAASLALVGPWHPYEVGYAVTYLACLAVLIALVGQERPDRRWLWLIGPIVLAELLVARVVPGTGAEADVIGVVTLCLLTLVSIAWLAVDARLAIAVIVFVLAESLPLAMANLVTGIELPFLGICAAVAAPAVWLLRRQSAHPGRPTQT